MERHLKIIGVNEDKKTSKMRNWCKIWPIYQDISYFISFKDYDFRNYMR